MNYIKHGIDIIFISLMLLVVGLCTRQLYADLSIGTQTSEPTHIAIGSFQVQKVSVGTNTTPVWEAVSPPTISTFSVFPTSVDLDLADNEKTSSITFNRRNTGNFWAIPSRSEGSVTGFTGLVTANHCYIGQTICRVGGIPNNVHFYIFSIQNTDPNYLNYSSVTINGRTYNLTRATSDFTSPSLGVTTRSYWTRDTINSADTITDSRLTLSIKFNLSKVVDKLRFDFSVLATTGKVNTCQIHNVTSNNANVGTSFVSSSGVALSQNLTNVDRPNQTTNYRLVCSNTGGSSHSDAQLTISQNPTVSNLRRTGFRQVDTGGNFQFTARITGYPQPVIDWVWGNGADSQRNNDNTRFTAVSGQVNTWDIVIGGLSGMYHPLLTDSFTVIVGNDSGSVRATIRNVSAK